MHWYHPPGQSGITFIVDHMKNCGTATKAAVSHEIASRMRVVIIYISLFSLLLSSLPSLLVTFVDIGIQTKKADNEYINKANDMAVWPTVLAVDGRCACSTWRSRSTAITMTRGIPNLLDRGEPKVAEVWE